MAGAPPPPPGGYAGPPYTGPPFEGPAHTVPPGHGAYGAYVPTPGFEPLGGLATAATVLAAVTVQTLSRRQTQRATALAAVPQWHKG